MNVVFWAAQKVRPQAFDLFDFDLALWAQQQDLETWQQAHSQRVTVKFFGYDVSRSET